MAIRSLARFALAKPESMSPQSTYDPAVAIKVCEGIARGSVMSHICTGTNGMPTRQSFARWCMENPALNKAFLAARELSAQAFEDDALLMASALHNHSDEFTSVKVRAYEVAMGQYRWSAARRNPKIYGDRADVRMVIPIQINTTLDLGEGSGDTTAEHPDIYTINAKVNADPPMELEAEAEPAPRTKRRRRKEPV